MSWHFFTYFPSALMMVCRKLRYWMCRPCVARQWIKWCSTDSLISEQSWKLLLKMCCIVSASRSWEREKQKTENKHTMNKHDKHIWLFQDGVFFILHAFHSPQVWERGWGVYGGESDSPDSLCRTSAGTDACTWWSPAFWCHSVNRKKIRCLGTRSRPCLRSTTDFICSKKTTNPIIGDLQQVQHNFVGAHVLQ